MPLLNRNIIPVRMLAPGSAELRGRCGGTRGTGWTKVFSAGELRFYCSFISVSVSST